MRRQNLIGIGLLRIARNDGVSEVANTDTGLQIDDAFIATWHPKYDETENDEEEYNTLVEQTAKDICLTNTLSEEIFWAIYKWKGAMRSKRYIHMDQYYSMYAPAFRDSALAAPELKLRTLLVDYANCGKLPGLRAPTASTILHFIHPDMMPIIDRRTAEVLLRARLVSTKGTEFLHYEGFRSAVDSIRLRCPNWTLRQIDRALFAFHKSGSQGTPSGSTPSSC
jgi:hypothetical protein